MRMNVRPWRQGVRRCLWACSLDSMDWRAGGTTRSSLFVNSLTGNADPRFQDLLGRMQFPVIE